MFRAAATALARQGRQCNAISLAAESGGSLAGRLAAHAAQIHANDFFQGCTPAHLLAGTMWQSQPTVNWAMYDQVRARRDRGGKRKTKFRRMQRQKRRKERDEDKRAAAATTMPQERTLVETPPPPPPREQRHQQHNWRRDMKT
eukprot:TRINITY_DN94736_c0_g1_i1.p1 TRINITY_DN94736_c0_g1~~TRINITY_DN94736_c0_g1_i1.p1  ORF type:complete len:144 (-),score=25.97 TRINITY_DN94736_c0_g1_i1:81-512(-)